MPGKGEGERAADWTPAVETAVEGSLRAGREITFTVRTMSMQPMFVPGDRLIVRSLTGGAPNIGDAVVRKGENGKGWVVHRLIGKSTRAGRLWLETKGDNTSQADAGLEAEELVGVAVGIQRGAREASLQAQQARLMNNWIARLSRRQSIMYPHRLGLMGSLTLKWIGLVLYATGRIARYSIGLR
jgi:signal peptidase I